METQITVPRAPFEFFSKNVLGNVNHVSDTLFAFPNAFSGTFSGNASKTQITFPKSPPAKPGKLRKRDLRFRYAKNVSETHRILGNVICVSDEKENAKKRYGNASHEKNASKTKKKWEKTQRKRSGRKKPKTSKNVS